MGLDPKDTYICEHCGKSVLKGLCSSIRHNTEECVDNYTPEYEEYLHKQLDNRIKIYMGLDKYKEIMGKSFEDIFTKGETKMKIDKKED